MTGFFCGLLRGRMPTFLAICLSYVPESIFTFFFLQWMAATLPAGTLTWENITVGVIMEGWVEVIIFSFIIDNMVRRKVVETAVLMLEIFIIMFLVHKEFLQTLLLLLLIALFTLILFELVERTLHKPGSGLPENKDKEQ
jgi:Ca2+/Na+ antiporter